MELETAERTTLKTRSKFEKVIFRYFLVLIFITFLFLTIITVVSGAGGNIDPTNKWAWGTNVGWVNFSPTHGGVTVYNDHLEGYAWGENMGWIRLGTHNSGGSYTYANNSASTYGVNHDGNGTLSGYAWGTNVGWINFNPTHGGVSIDLNSGNLNGYAWGENIGWISFRNSDDIPYNVATNYRAPSGDPNALPETGFPKDRVTVLPVQPESKEYTSTDLILEIPDLSIKTKITGIPISGGVWDLAWLGGEAGWLHGTAFPSWAGNSAITGHVYDANGNPGIFHNLQRLKWGNTVIVHAYDQSYVYEVRSIDRFVNPDDTSLIFQHEEFPWLTLITCKGFDADSNAYRWRVVVKAVQTRIQ